ncbi:DUF2752 domain-containing protein [Ruminococcaceae bacterium OttesenSCG-928-I18]|nr:DUF2752 domain-containing protein [Ruminococcaceae bacterium OttesenSCG-928-I18]
MKIRFRNLFLYLLVFLFLFIFLGILYQYFGIGVPCPLHLITGWYCPGCGMFRSLLSLSQLQFYQAFRYNALFVILLPLIVFFLGRAAYDYLQNRPSRTYRWELVLCIILIIIFLIFGILRNLPAFSFLAPTPLPA